MPRTAPRDPSYSTADLKPVIFTPDALPMFADQGHRESLHQKDKRAKKLKPTEPIHGAGKGGRLGQSATQGLVQDIFMKERINEDVSDFVVGAEEELKLICPASRSVTQIRRQEGRRREEGVIVGFHYSICISFSYTLRLGYNTEQKLPDFDLFRPINLDHSIKPFPRFPCISGPSPRSGHYRALQPSPQVD
jgi:hypothetical protein